MRLLNVHTKRITEFLDEERPPYAILSHTWGKSEITPQDLEKLYGNEARESVEPNESVIDSGYAKIKGSCAQALKDDLEWVWIDTCCIDKANSAELSEAINSMFRWYNEAMICYVYLSDVSGIDIAIPDSSFCQSRWFTRGWTLQELLAPTRVHFYENSWDFLGTRDSLCDALQFATGIPEDVLKGDQLRETSIAQRMSWASKRNTSRREDMAYCLLGIFDVNMPLLYGEGDKAFLRLQEEVAKGSRDDSLFAWGINQSSLHGNSDDFGILARSPHDFAGCGKVVQCQIVPQYGFLNTGGHTGFELAKQGVRMSIPVSEVQTTNTNQKRLYVGVLNCRLASTHDENHLLGIPLVPAALVNPLAHLTKDSVSMERPRFLATIPFEEARIRNITTIFVGSASGVTYKTDPKSAIIQYDSSVVPAEIRLFVRYSTLIIPPPRGFFRWHPTLLYDDPCFCVTVRRSNSQSFYSEPVLESWSAGVTQRVYLLYEADRINGETPTCFILRLTLARSYSLPCWILRILTLAQFRSGRHSGPGMLECSLASLSKSDLEGLSDLGDLNTLEWGDMIIMGQRTLSTRISCDGDFLWLYIDCSLTTSGFVRWFRDGRQQLLQVFGNKAYYRPEMVFVFFLGVCFLVPPWFNEKSIWPVCFSTSFLLAIGSSLFSLSLQNIVSVGTTGKGLSFFLSVGLLTSFVFAIMKWTLSLSSE